MPAWNGQFSCDNALALWIGTEHEVVRKLEAAKILATTSKTGPAEHSLWFSSVTEIRRGARIQETGEGWEYLYLVAWSDGNAWQGLIGSVTGTKTVATGDAGWQVYPAGQHNAAAVVPGSSDPAPSKSEVDAFISDANTNARWVDPFSGPKGAQGPWSAESWYSNAEWIWHRPDDFTPLAATQFKPTDPSGVFTEPGTPSSRKSEPLLFRLPLNLLGPEWSVDCCNVLSARINKQEFFATDPGSIATWHAPAPAPGASALNTFPKWDGRVLTAPADGLYRVELSGRRGSQAGQPGASDDLHLSLMRGGPAGAQPGQDQVMHRLVIGVPHMGTTSSGAVVSLQAGDSLYVSAATTGQTLGQLVDASWVVFRLCCDHDQPGQSLTDLEVLCDLIEVHFDIDAPTDLCACVYERLLDRYGPAELATKLKNPGLTFLHALQEAVQLCG